MHQMLVEQALMQQMILELERMQQMLVEQALMHQMLVELERMVVDWKLLERMVLEKMIQAIQNIENI
jgi:hypothetical protein